ncbi:MAG: SagB/ThcOx family dehydrogenase [Alphaproteobacteria bacterium]
MISKKLAVLAAVVTISFLTTNLTRANENNIIKLPEITNFNDASLYDAIKNRRSRRTFDARALEVEEVAALLFAAQGQTDASGKRTAPSARATYPLNTYVVVNNVNGLSQGIYQYNGAENSLTLKLAGDFSKSIAASANNQASMVNAKAVVIFTSIHNKTAGFKDLGSKFAYMETGHASQNLYLAAEALKLGTVTVVSFNETVVKDLFKFDNDEEVIYFMPVGAQEK